MITSQATSAMSSGPIRSFISPGLAKREWNLTTIKLGSTNEQHVGRLSRLELSLAKFLDLILPVAKPQSVPREIK